jgi:hypothetical protein
MTKEVRRNAQEVNGQKFFFFAIFRTFAMDTTLLRLIFIQNVKKGKNQPTLMCTTAVTKFCSPCFSILTTRNTFFLLLS